MNKIINDSMLGNTSKKQEDQFIVGLLALSFESVYSFDERQVFVNAWSTKPAKPRELADVHLPLLK